MIFSKACEYGIRATILIAQHSLNTNRVSLKFIAQEIASPEAFTAKILQSLSRNKIIESIKGPSGGFEMDLKRMKTIKLYNIVAAIDGVEVMNACGLGLKKCNAKQPCPIHNQFAEIRNNLNDMLKQTSVYEVALGLKEGVTFVKS